MATAGPRFIQGAAEGVVGEGIPKGRASEFEGGAPRFGGRAIGAGAKSLGESLWQGLVQMPGRALAGGKDIGFGTVPPATFGELEQGARGTAMAMAGQGGFAPGRALPGLAERPPGFNLGGRPLPGPPPPPGQLMLPPPTIGVAGQPATSTGQIGTPGAFRAGLEAGGRTLGEAPPTSMVSGGALSPWREGMEAGGVRTLQEANQGLEPQVNRLGLGGQPRVLPAGPQPGMLPPGPTSTMTHPSATPVGDRPPIPPQAPPAAPVRPPPPSNPVRDTATVDQYRQAVLPGLGRRRKAPLVEGYENAVTTAVDEIIGNQPNLRLTAPNGMPLPPGSQVPKTMRQFSESIDQSLKTLFEQWNPMAQRAGERGLRIDLAPVANELRSLAKRPETLDVTPELARKMEAAADRFEARGFYTPLEAQDAIKAINAERTATGLPDMTLEPAARVLRKSMDEGIEALEGPGWQDFRNKYKALRMLEGDVVKAGERIANRPEGTINKWGSVAANAHFLHGLFTKSPEVMALGLGVKGAVALNKFLNSPNRMIDRMFADRMRGPSRAANVAGPLTQGVAQPAMSYRLSQPPPQSGGFPQPKRDPDEPLRRSVGSF